MHSRWSEKRTQESSTVPPFGPGDGRPELCGVWNCQREASTATGTTPAYNPIFPRAFSLP